MTQSDRKSKHGLWEWRAGRREWAMRQRKLMSWTSPSSTHSRRSKRLVNLLPTTDKLFSSISSQFMDEDSSSISQSLDMIFYFSLAVWSIWDSCSFFDTEWWNIYDNLWCFLLPPIVDLPRRAAHLQASHRAVQSINPEAYCRLSRRWHLTDKTHDGER